MRYNFLAKGEAGVSDVAIEPGWFVLVSGAQIGPMTIEALRDGLRLGTISLSDMAWRPGFSDWRPIAEIEGLGRPPATRAPPPAAAGGRNSIAAPLRVERSQPEN